MDRTIPAQEARCREACSIARAIPKPGEIDLAKVCGVSRPTIREAMVALEIAGELEIRSGSGAPMYAPFTADSHAVRESGIVHVESATRRITRHAEGGFDLHGPGRALLNR